MLLICIEIFSLEVSKSLAICLALNHTVSSKGETLTFKVIRPLSYMIILLLVSISPSTKSTISWLSSMKFSSGGITLLSIRSASNFTT